MTPVIKKAHLVLITSPCNAVNLLITFDNILRDFILVTKDCFSQKLLSLFFVSNIMKNYIPEHLHCSPWLCPCLPVGHLEGGHWALTGNRPCLGETISYLGISIT